MVLHPIRRLLFGLAAGQRSPTQRPSRSLLLSPRLNLGFVWFSRDNHGFLHKHPLISSRFCRWKSPQYVGGWSEYSDSIYLYR